MISRRSEFDIWHADWYFTVYGKVLTEQNMTVKPTPVLADVNVSYTVASDWLRDFHIC